MAITGLAAQAAQFQFSSLIRWGANGSAPANWELGLGNSSGSITNTQDLTPGFGTTGDRLFQVDYNRSTNTATLRVFDDTTTGGTSDSVSFNPTGGGTTAINATWTLPASAFFVQVLGEPTFSSMEVRNLSLVTGTIITPLQTTPVTVAQAFGFGAGTVNAAGNVTFLGDASGNWRLQGIVSATGVGFGPTVNGVSFGLSASASDAPEPMASVLVGFGLVVVALAGRRQREKQISTKGAV
jgi:hypothetical protein